MSTYEHVATQHCLTCWPLPRSEGTKCSLSNCDCHKDPFRQPRLRKD